MCGTSSSQGAAGQLDPSFGHKGVALATLPKDGGGASSLAVAPDGKYVVGGWLWTGPAQSEVVLVRFHSDGTQDRGFGEGGAVITSLSGPNGAQSAFAFQADGKIVVVGGDSAYDVARYMPDGTLDSTFGAGGKVSSPVEDPAAVVIQADGNIVVVGTNTAADAFTLARFRSDGSLDPGFGHNGVVTTSIGPVSVATALLLQPDGRIVAGGWDRVDYREDTVLTRYLPDGSLDDTFGSQGIVTTPGSSLNPKMALQGDGKILAGDQAGNGQYMLTRYLPDGSLDSEFGIDGTLITQAPSASWLSQFALQADGDIVVGGTGSDLFPFVELVRYKPDGSLDTSFGEHGVLRGWIRVNGGQVYLSYVAGLDTARSGRITVAANEGASFVLARFLTDPNCLVPNLRGRRALGARLTLPRYGCRVGRVTRRYSHGVRKGRVVFQRPLPELVKSRGTRVSFVVSKGPRRR